MSILVVMPQCPPAQAESLVEPRVSRDGERIENALTLSGWGAVAGAFALAAVVLGSIVLSWKRCVLDSVPLSVVKCSTALLPAPLRHGGPDGAVGFLIGAVPCPDVLEAVHHLRLAAVQLALSSRCDQDRGTSLCSAVRSMSAVELRHD